MAHSCLTALARQRTNPKPKRQGKQPKQIIYLECGSVRKALPSGVQGCINFLPQNFMLDLKRTAEIPL